MSETFDRSRWETKDAMTAWVRKFDPSITTMYESGGRAVRYGDRIRGLTARYHLYGQQLGWHTLYLVAGEFLAKYPVIQRPYDDDDSWREWLRREALTRDDGLWLADGVDRPPVDAQVNLYEKGEKGLVLTGDEAKLLSLLNIESSIAKEVVVVGDWHSADGIGIHITSAQAWLPRAEEYDGGDEYSPSEREPYKPWIVWPSIQARLDETDPLGVTSAVQRLHFTKAVNAISSLKPRDPFRRTWANLKGRVAVRSEAWGRNTARDEEESISAVRLVCTSTFLKNVLSKHYSELLVLIMLSRYDKGFGSRGSQYWHTTAVIRIDRSLDLSFIPVRLISCM